MAFVIDLRKIEVLKKAMLDCQAKRNRQIERYSEVRRAREFLEKLKSGKGIPGRLRIKASSEWYDGKMFTSPPDLKVEVSCSRFNQEEQILSTEIIEDNPTPYFNDSPSIIWRPFLQINVKLWEMNDRKPHILLLDQTFKQIVPEVWGYETLNIEARSHYTTYIAFVDLNTYCNTVTLRFTPDTPYPW